jgi:serine/threonine-protein kinase
VQPGHTVAGKYKIERLLGEGGMGAVYVAENVVLQKRVALKVLSADMQRTPNAVERFMREAVSASQVKHPAIVEVYDAGAEGGSPWIAMELLNGESLRDRLVRVSRLSPQEAVSIIKQVLPALAAVHDRGIVHRDLKPDNLFLEQRDGSVQVKILDFGIAKATIAATNLTSTGTVLGTAFYLAPEQARDAASVDHRTDIYAIGAILYECMSGRTPYQAESVTELIARMFTEDPPSLTFTAPHVPPELANIVQACLARDINMRPQNARELLAHLERLPKLSSGPLPAAVIAPTFVHPTTAPQGASALPSGPPPSMGYTPSPMPGYAPTPPPYSQTTYPVRAQKKGGGAIAWIIVAVLAVLALVLLVPIGIVAYVLLVNDPSTVESGGDGIPRLDPQEGSESSDRLFNLGIQPFIQWDGVYTPDLADVNSDGNPDVIGWIREIRVPADDMPVYVAAYDGTDGSELWRTTQVSGMSNYMNARRALAGNVVVTVDEGAMVRAFRTADGELAWSFSLPERAERICDAGPGFVEIVTADERFHRVALADGTLSAGNGGCDRRLDAQIPTGFSSDGPYIWMPHNTVGTANVAGMDVSSAVMDPGGRIVAFGTRDRGTRVPMVGVVGSWQSDLPSAEPLRATQEPPDGAAIANGNVYVTFVHDSVTKITAFDVQTGRRLFEEELEGASAEAKIVIPTRDRIYVSHWTWLDAIDARTGERIFRIGRWN